MVSTVFPKTATTSLDTSNFHAVLVQDRDSNQ
jgi:hypothetical protein